MPGFTRRVCTTASCGREMDAMPEDASMQEREDKLTVPNLTSERNAEQGSDRKVAQRKRIHPRSVRLLQVIAIVALELLLHPV